MAFVTIDIGADDVQTCQTPPGSTPPAPRPERARSATDLPKDLGALKAAYPGLPIYGMDYYDPFLAYWLQGASGQAVATQTVTGTDQLNALLGQIYRTAGVSMADPASLFQTDDTDPIGTYQGTTVPQDVAVVCQWTGMCTSNDIHANDQGHVELAQAFDQVIDHVAIDTTGVPAGSVKTAYSATLTANGGNAPYRWRVTSGSLPAGLRLQAATGFDQRQAHFGRRLHLHRAGHRHQGPGQAADPGLGHRHPVTPGPAPGPGHAGQRALLVPPVQPVPDRRAHRAVLLGPGRQRRRPAAADGHLRPAGRRHRPPAHDHRGPRGIVRGREPDRQRRGHPPVGPRRLRGRHHRLPAGRPVPGRTATTRWPWPRPRRWTPSSRCASSRPTPRPTASTRPGSPWRASRPAGHWPWPPAWPPTPPYTGPLSNYSPSIAAAVSTGAFLTPGLPTITLTNSEAPSLLFQYAYDTATHVTAAYAFETCDALRAAGNACYEVELAGTGHTTWLVPGGPWWTNELGPFIWNELHLATAAT